MPITTGGAHVMKGSFIMLSVTKDPFIAPPPPR
jgi:hypothetical protein